MSVLVDTNVLVFATQQGHPLRQECVQAIERVIAKGISLYLLPQNIAEFWNVCTRPIERNGLGLTPRDTNQRLNQIDSFATILHDSQATYARWRELLVKHEVKGIQVFDARIAAAVQVHSIKRILTYNPRDFGRYDGIVAIGPADVATGLNI